MSNQYPGGIITKNPATPTGPYQDGAAPGIWTLSQQAGYKKQGIWPTAGLLQPDPQFNYVPMLLHGDGTNGAQNNTFLDSSTNNFTITRYGNTTQGSFSPYGSNWSTSFVRLGTGFGDGFTFPNSTALQMGTGDFTIEMWVFETATVSYQTFYEKGYVNAGGFLLQMFTDLKPYVYANGSLLMTSSTAIALNVWTHLAVVRSGSTMTMYLNGVSVASASNSTNFNDASIGGIGARSLDNTYPFNGYLSNLRVVKGTAVYTGTFTPPTSPLTAISGTSLLVMQSNRFIDNSGNNVTLTAQNTPSVQRFNPFGASTAYSTNVIGGSVYYDASGDSLSTPVSVANNPQSGDDYTVEAWIYITVVGGVTSIYSGNTVGYFAYRSAGRFEFVSSATELRLTYTAPLNRWCHVAVTRQSGTLRMFIDGALTSPTVASGSATGNTDTLVGASTVYYFGSYTDSTSGPFGGYISNFRIVKGTAVYTAAFTPPTAPLTAITNTAILLNNTNGAIFDNAMMNNLETLGNTQISTSVVKYGTGSIYFDGVGDAMIAKPNDIFSFRTANFTVEAWVYMTNTDAVYDSILEINGHLGPNGIIFIFNYIGSASIYAADAGGGAFIAPQANAGINVWTHVAWVRNNGTLRTYINGTSTSSASLTLDIKCNTSFTIGSNASITTGYCHNGYIDELRITNGYARYTSNFTPPTAAFPNTGPT
jgi:hypothetical protein